MKPKRKRILIALSLVILTGVILVCVVRCPESGIAFSAERRTLNQLKNRTTPPRTTDFDQNATLQSLLAPGDDRKRWSESRAARIEGYVQSVAAARTELANCYCGRDIHIHISLNERSQPHEQFVLEITPRVSPSMDEGTGTSVPELQRALVGHWVRFEGWLLFDHQHADESENIAPGRTDNWRATAWEIHPITRIAVIR